MPRRARTRPATRRPRRGRPAKRPPRPCGPRSRRVAWVGAGKKTTRRAPTRSYPQRGLLAEAAGRLEGRVSGADAGEVPRGVEKAFEAAQAASDQAAASVARLDIRNVKDQCSEFHANALDADKAAQAAQAALDAEKQKREAQQAAAKASSKPSGKVHPADAKPLLRRRRGLGLVRRRPGAAHSRCSQKPLGGGAVLGGRSSALSSTIARSGRTRQGPLARSHLWPHARSSPSQNSTTRTRRVPRVTGRTLWWLVNKTQSRRRRINKKSSSSPASGAELACEKENSQYISQFTSMAWGTRPRAAIEIVARSREHDVKRVYATAIVVLLVPQSASGCHRVVFYNPRHDVHSGRIISEVRCPLPAPQRACGREAPGTAR